MNPDQLTHIRRVALLDPDPVMRASADQWIDDYNTTVRLGIDPPPVPRALLLRRVA